MIGLPGLLNLLTVVTRLRAVQQECASGPQEAGALCPLSPPNQRLRSALPPAPEGAEALAVGPVAVGQSAAALAPARSTRRTPAESHHHEPPHRQRGSPA